MGFSDRDDAYANPRLTVILLVVLLAAVFIVGNADAFSTAYAGIGALFLIPAAIGGLGVQISDPGGRNSQMGCFVWPTLGLIAISAVAWLIFGEGAICIAIILPLWLPAAIVGALVTRYNARRSARRERGTSLNSAAWLPIPFLVISAEVMVPPPWTHHMVVRETIVDARPDVIWPLLLRVPKISAEEGNWNFTQDILRVPRPTDANLVMRGGQLVRVAHWGRDLSFEEVITERLPGRALGWKFLFPNQSVQSHTDHHISPDGPLLKIETGRYEIQPLQNGRSRLRLTTDYHMRTRLGAYLAWWGNQLIGDVQGNVLAVIKQRSEAVRVGTY